MVDSPVLSFAEQRRRAVAVPLGGIGTGTFALRADGLIDQVQLMNSINHRSFVPAAFFALRAESVRSSLRGIRAARTLAAEPADPPPDPPRDTSDWQRPDALFDWPLMPASTARVAYPFVTIDFPDPAGPVSVAVRAFTPFVPTDETASALPVVDYEVRLASSVGLPLYGFVIFAFPNIVGWDGVAPLRDLDSGSFGGNVNRLVTAGRDTAIVMDNPSLAEDDPFAGEIVIWTDAPCLAIPRADGAATILRTVQTFAPLHSVSTGDWSEDGLRTSLRTMTRTTRTPTGPSAPGRTWVAALCAMWALQPGQATTLRFAQAWRFPNRYVDFHQHGIDLGPAGHRIWVGNHYSARFGTARDALTAYLSERETLRDASASWAAAVDGADLPMPVRRVLATQSSQLRTPVTFRTANGGYYGFEGGAGVSTANWSGDAGGSCPLNCNHVWNYAQATSRIFPELERSMRRAEWASQAGDGSLPHRIALPQWLPPAARTALGGPSEPALDGMLGAILKTYREARNGGGIALLAEYWPQMRRLVEHVRHRWDADGDGVLRGPQPTTFDEPLTGANMFIGALWLAALRAMTVAGGLLAEPESERRYGALFATAAARYDELLWNGEYYQQLEVGADLDYGTGCLSDQLLGQWWAHQLELGHLLPADRVRSALRAILTHNDRRAHRHRDLGVRTFADEGEGGLLNCSWPRGGRPDIPVRYCDESWTGTEYQVAAHCFMEGLTGEALGLLEAVWARHDGTRRNPFNPVECGDHYVRAMSGWSLLEAATGHRFDAISRRLVLATGSRRYPVLAGTGWLEVEFDETSHVRLTVGHGTIDLDTVRIDDVDHPVNRPLRAGEVIDIMHPIAPAADRDAHR